MGALFERYRVEPVKGTDITIGNHFPEVFVSETDEVLCYLGICLNDESRKYTFMIRSTCKGNIAQIKR